jgi:hypothetical protein
VDHRLAAGLTVALCPAGGSLSGCSGQHSSGRGASGPGGSPTTASPATASPTSLPAGRGGEPSVGDVNGDGYADVAFSGATADGGYGVWVLRGGPEGLTVIGAQTLGGFPTPPPAALLDTTGDRRAELAVGKGFHDPTDPEVRVLRGTASGLDVAHPTVITPADLSLTPVPGDAFGSGFGR